MGVSAGGTSCLWLGIHSDLKQSDSIDPVANQSTRPAYIAVDDAQTSLDPHLMRKWISNSLYGGHAFGVGTISREGCVRPDSLGLIAS